MATPGSTTLFLRELPTEDVLIVLDGKNKGKATQELLDWAGTVQRQAASSPVAPNPASLIPNISGSGVGTLGGVFTKGLYAVYAYREVIVADPVSSSLNIVLTFTHNGKPLTRSYPVFAGVPQTTADNDGPVAIIAIDANTTIGYQITYASNTPGLGRFDVTLLANLLQTLS